MFHKTEDSHLKLKKIEQNVIESKFEFYGNAKSLCFSP